MPEVPMAACLSATCPRIRVLPIWLRQDFPVVFVGYADGAVNRPRRQEARKRSLSVDILQTCCLYCFGEVPVSIRKIT